MISVNELRYAMAKAPVPSVSTPFLRDGLVDFTGLRNQVDFYIHSGAGLVIITYGDSLFSVLLEKEIAELTKAVVSQTAKRAVVIAATGMWWTGKCVGFAEFAKETGADVLMSLPPNWAGSTDNKGFVSHYEEISKVMPVMTVTATGGAGLPLLVISELVSGQNNIISIKDDVCGNYGRSMAPIVRDKWAVLSGGLKENHLDIKPFGVDGYLSVFMRFAPEIAKRYWKCINSGDISGAVEIIERCERPFIYELTAKTGLDFDSLIHAAMEIAGVCKRYRRKPYRDADETQMETINEFMKEKSII